MKDPPKTVTPENVQNDPKMVEIRTHGKHIVNIFLPVKLGGGPTLPHFKEQNL